MMKVSDPIMFGHVVRAYFPDVFADYADDLASVGADPDDGLAAVLTAIAETAGRARGRPSRRPSRRTTSPGPSLAMVDSDRGITNLHVPSDIIVDASMPAAIRTSGQMWNRAGELQDTKYVIPDSSYAPLYAETVDFCREHGAFDPTTMGTTPNVGLMALKAEEYGSHDKTFEIAAPGKVRVVDSAGTTLLEHDVEDGRHLARLPDQGRGRHRLGAPCRRAGPGDRFAGRLLARRDPRRTTPRSSRRCRRALPDHDTSGLTLEFLPVARGHPLHARAGQERRGHHRRHRQRAARLPHRPLPDPRARHVGQDAVDRAVAQGRRAFRDRCRRIGAQARPAVRQGKPPALGFARRVPGAVGVVRVPGRQVRQQARRDPRPHPRRRDRRACSKTASPRRARSGSSTTGAATSTSRSTGRRRWPSRPTTPTLAELFAPLAKRLADEEETIVGELAAVQGKPVDLGGYYFVDDEKADAAMRPSTTLNAALAEF